MEIEIPKDDEGINESSSLLSDRSIRSTRSYKLQLELEEEYEIVLLDTLGGRWRFLYMIFLVYVCGLMGNSALIYNMPLMTLKPQLECRTNQTSDWIHCVQTDYCKTDEELRRIDWTSNMTLQNWITDLDLICVKKVEIQKVGSFYFLGMVCSLLIFPRLSEILGRLYIMYCMATCLIISQTGILFFSYDLQHLHFFYFILGCLTTIQVCVGYNYMMDFVPKKNKFLFSTFLLAAYVIPSIIYPIYFKHISKNWRYFHIPFLLMGYTSSCLLISQAFESPKYLFFQKSFEELEKCLNWIKRLNFKGEMTEDIDLATLEMRIRRYESSKMDRMMCDNNLLPWKEVGKKSFLWNIAILIILWTTSVFNYYGSTFFLSNSRGDLLKNSMYMQIYDIVAILFSGVLLKFTNIEKSLTVFYSLAAVSALLYILPPNESEVSTSLFFVKFGISATMNYLFLCTNIIMHPDVVGTAFAIVNLFSRIVTIWAPELSDFSDTLQMWVCLGSSLLSAYVVNYFDYAKSPIEQEL